MNNRPIVSSEELTSESIGKYDTKSSFEEDRHAYVNLSFCFVHVMPEQKLPFKWLPVVSILSALLKSISAHGKSLPEEIREAQRSTKWIHPHSIMCIITHLQGLHIQNCSTRLHTPKNIPTTSDWGYIFQTHLKHYCGRK